MYKAQNDSAHTVWKYVYRQQTMTVHVIVLLHIFSAIYDNFLDVIIISMFFCLDISATKFRIIQRQLFGVFTYNRIALTHLL